MRRSLMFLFIGIIIGSSFFTYLYFKIKEQRTQEFIIASQTSIVTQLQALSRLTTAEMTIEKVIE